MMLLTLSMDAVIIYLVAARATDDSPAVFIANKQSQSRNKKAEEKNPTGRSLTISSALRVRRRK